ncbi:shieldin complex subunit 3 [Conger conger]|uniref:shieldin complex subunit 3 n=1 Tax=Conger conger TaxID=82655 RepID=UPI002A5A07C6|nr:shieldin complex subunit 3 [Conger conger]XP_061117449.1 shieldin complex subunit 3 [Conger conger]XP_061117450.1 shieldin complex subunit 3 [Conger conger]XP_061117451.1 shieldin complex subunit 3 [Conger conger]XP_061117452.1 shieldin complex subunit 3 [Conger conger]XP_061117453.1 shieldin complex subunit 3 [Conger conger]
MDVFLHYKSNKGNLRDLVDLAEKALEEFPCRILPTFTPWFPSGGDKSLPIKPQKSAPVISVEDQKQIQFYLWCSEPLLSARSDCEFEGLKEFSTADVKQSLSRRRVISEDAASKAHDDIVSGDRRLRRSWSAVTLGSLLSLQIQPFSRQFQKVVERFGLHSLQRAKWIIEEPNCVSSDLEHVWTVLCQATRQSKLPTCNANIQRNLLQIWVFCDVLYSEYVGHFLKRELCLSGQISLAVHRQGTIFNL